eukprot:7342094-Ditylum_brightwellii.AAC.1
MQELPLMFPFTDEEIKENATNPDKPSDWPEYGTEAFVDRLKKQIETQFEMALCFQQLQWHCSFDPPSYFPSDPASLPMVMPRDGMKGDFDDSDDSQNGLWLLLDHCVVSIQTNVDQTLKIGCGASKFEIVDERKHCH